MVSDFAGRWRIVSGIYGNFASSREGMTQELMTVKDTFKQSFIFVTQGYANDLGLNNAYKCKYKSEPVLVCSNAYTTVKFLNFGTPEIFAVIYLNSKEEAKP